MQVVGKEVKRYTVSPVESGLTYPLQVIIYSPRNAAGLMAKVLPLQDAELYDLSDEAITWEDAAWQ